MSKKISILSFLLLVTLFFSASLLGAQDATEAPAPTEVPPTATPVVPTGDADLTLLSTQFNTVEEADKFRDILADFTGGSVEFVGVEEPQMINLLTAEGQSGQGVIDVAAALHGTFPALISQDLLFDLTGQLGTIEGTSDVSDAYVELGRMGTTDVQYYIPWLQATYVMAAHNDALAYLPEGVDLNTMTWEQLGQWCQALMDGTGEAKCGFPVKGLFHRFLQGYLWPSFTGGMVSQFNSEGAVEGLNWVRDSLWPTVNPESINYDFMNVPLLSGEVWVAFDHTARLKPALDERPDDFVVFPAPSGPSGRGFMPVIVGLAVPFTSDNPDAADALVAFLLSPETQSRILNELGFFPVIAGVDMSALPPGVAKTAAAVEMQTVAADSIPSLLPIGLGARGGDINQIFRDAFNRVVVNGEDTQTVLDEQAALLQSLMDDTGAPCWAPDPAGEGACQIESLAGS